MKSKKILFASLFSILSTFLLAGTIFGTNSNLIRVFSDEVTYSKTCNFSTFYSESEDEVEKDVKTSGNNPLIFRHQNVYRDYDLKYYMKAGSYIKNYTAIKGLKSITINGLRGSTNTSVGELTIEYGWNYCGYQNSTTISGNSTTNSIAFDFNGERPTYFTLRNKDSYRITFNSMSFEYSCQETEMPASYYQDQIRFLLSNNSTYYYVSPMNKYEIVDANIPATYNGKPVRSLESNAFYGSETLERISLPDSMTSLSNSAFYKCKKLSEVELPESLTKLNDKMFEQSGIKKLRIPSSIKSIPQYLCYKCESLESVDLGSVTLVDYSAFEQCSALKSIKFSNSLETIGSFAFDSCTSLVSVTNLPASLKSIGNSAFRRCSNLVDFIVPDNVTTIGHEAFDSCPSLKTFKFGASVQSVDMTAFCDDAGLKCILIPSEITTLGEMAFYGCNQLSIYTEHASKPDGWHDNWNSQNRPVYWNTTKAEHAPEDPTIFENHEPNTYFEALGQKWLFDELTYIQDVEDIIGGSSIHYDGENNLHYFFDNEIWFEGRTSEQDYYLDITFNVRALVFTDTYTANQASLGSNLRDGWSYIHNGDVAKYEYYAYSREGDEDACVSFTIYQFNS